MKIKLKNLEKNVSTTCCLSADGGCICCDLYSGHLDTTLTYDSTKVNNYNFENQLGSFYNGHLD